MTGPSRAGSGPRRQDGVGAPSFPPIPFLDSHAHLAGEGFDTDRDGVLQRLREAGGRGVVCIGESLAAAARAREVAATYPGEVWWTAGVHPHDAAEYDPLRDGPAIDAAMHEGAVAVGECGLDYHYDHSPRPQQRRAFADQLAIAQRTGRAVVVHTREAVEDTIEVSTETDAAALQPAAPPQSS